MMNIEMNNIALKYNCWVDNNHRIYLLLTEKKYIGKIYWKETTNYYHAINKLEKKYEGQKDFEVLLINFLKGENII